MPNVTEADNQARRSTCALRFWGVRGSTPTPVAANLGVGGDTACVQVLHGDPENAEVLILDAGSGIRLLGHELAEQAIAPAHIHIFFTHLHWDHLQGLPFFTPLFMPGVPITFYSAHSGAELREALKAQMHPPFFPVEFESLHSQFEFRQIEHAPVIAAGVTFEAFDLHHPQGSVGYRVSCGAWTAVYATDHEHGVAEVDERLARKCAGADVIVCDAQYTPQQAEKRHGWGHSTWHDAAELATQAQVKKLVLFHHDPDRDDEAVAAIEKQAQAMFAATHAAREGLQVQ